jgi:hypothetical protein
MIAFRPNKRKTGPAMWNIVTGSGSAFEVVGVAVGPDNPLDAARQVLGDSVVELAGKARFAKSPRARKPHRAVRVMGITISQPEGWQQTPDGYVSWRIIQEQGEQLIEWKTNPYHQGGGWSTDVDILLGKKQRADGRVGGELVQQWAKALSGLAA